MRPCPLAGCGNGTTDKGGTSSGKTPETAIQLTVGVWEKGTLATVDGEQWFKFTATGDTHYIHFDLGTLTGVYVQLYDSSKEAVGVQTVLHSGNLYTSREVTSGNVYYIKITSANALTNTGGTFQIEINTSSTPTVVSLPKNATELTAGVWGDGAITASSGVQWFKFTSTAVTQYIHFNPGTLSIVVIQLFDNAGAKVGEMEWLADDALYISRQVINSSEYYIRLTPYASTGNGVFQILFNTSSTPAVVVLPTANVTRLSAGVWADGSITGSSGIQWFKFSATAASHYIHFAPNPLNNVFVQLYNNTGTRVGDNRNLNGNDYVSRSVTNGNEYYIKVTPPDTSYSGAFQITFNNSSTPPNITLPTKNVTQLTSGVWTNGVAAKGVDQWFKFSATAASHYIHFNPGTVLGVDVQVYNINGATVGDKESLYGNDYTVTSGSSEYYIRVTTPFTSSGTYQIAFNASGTPPAIIVQLPTTNVTTLSAGKWADGSIAASTGAQWFKFTATADTQYIHFAPGTLSDVFIQLYDNTGTSVGGRGNLYDSTYSSYIYRQVTTGNEYYIRITPYGGSGTYKITFNASSTAPGIVVTLPTTNVTTLTVGVWADGIIANTSGEQWFKFTATAASQYIHFSSGTLSDVFIQLYDNTGTSVGGRGNLYDSTYSSYISRQVTSGDVYYIRITPASGGSGAFKIAFNTSYTSPGITINLPTENVTTLSAGVWADGSIASSGGLQWFKFSATATSQYIHFAPGTLDDVYVQVYDSTGAPSGTRTNLYGSTLYISRAVTSGNEYYIRVTPYSGSGAYKIAFNTSSTPPVNLPTNVTQLTVNVWTDGSITTSGGEQWFKFSATSLTQYIHFSPGTLNDVYVQLYDDTGATVGARTELYGSTLYISRSVASGSEYYIRVTPYSSYTGAYQIVFTTSSTPPVNLPTTNVTQLTAGKWTDGSIALGGTQWFKFSATSFTQYIHFSPGALANVYVQLYDAEGAVVGSQTALNSSTSYTSRSVTNSNEYYIKVTPYNSSYSGSYQIGVTTSTTLPVITLPTENITTLTANVWADGSITLGGVQWFKFNATALTQYIHFSPGTLNDVYVQLYDDTGATVGARTELYGSTLYISRSVASGSEYYIRVMPYSGSGAYQIAFNTTTTPPLPTDAITLTAGKWADGSIASSGGEQWFKFSATYSSQYIHFSPGTLNDVYVQLYDSTGAPSGTRTNLYGTTLYTPRAVTNGNEYYIKVTPYSGSGAYQIGITTSTTPPSSITLPTENVTELTGGWTNGSITTGGVQWFKFTATADTQYIHFGNTGTLTSVYVQLYDNDGAEVGAKTNLTASTSTPRTVTSGNVYYIKVTPYNSSGSGAYQIAVGDS